LTAQTFDDLETFLREVLQEKLEERIEPSEANDTSQCHDC